MKKLALAFALCFFSATAFADTPDEKMAPTVSCEQFRERFMDALLGNREGIALAGLFTGSKQEKLDVPGVQSAIGCDRSGMFEGFGAALVDLDDGSRKRLARISAAAVRAIDAGFDHSAAVQFIGDLHKETLQDARSNEKKSGWLRGEAEKQLGHYIAMHSVGNDLVRTSIELRDKQ
ncbi:hypothetical protein ACVIGB_001022 [Bradyrhizobium sp. USDA 4341]